MNPFCCLFIPHFMSLIDVGHLILHFCNICFSLMQFRVVHKKEKEKSHSHSFHNDQTGLYPKPKTHRLVSSSLTTRVTQAKLHRKQWRLCQATASGT